MGHHLIIAAVVMASMSMSESAGQTPSSIPEPFQDCPDCPVMVPLPAGRFVMGADDQRALNGGNSGLWGGNEGLAAAVFQQPFQLTLHGVQLGFQAFHIPRC